MRNNAITKIKLYHIICLVISLLFVIYTMYGCSSSSNSLPDELDGYEFAAYEKYNSYAEDNGLSGTKIYIYGELNLVDEIEGITYGNVITKDGNWSIIFGYTDEKEINDSFLNKSIYAFGSYSGYSDRLKTPDIYIDKIKCGDVIKSYNQLSDLIKLNPTEISTQPQTSEKTEPATQQPTKNLTQSQTVAPKKEQVIFDNNGIKITYTGLASDWLGTKVKLKIENNTETNYCVQVRNTSVNGYMVDPIFSCDVNSGKIANDELTFIDKVLKENNITTIDNLEFNFHIFSQDDWQDSFDTETIVINP